MLELSEKIDECYTRKLVLPVKEVWKLIRALEINFITSQRHDRLLLMALRLASSRKESLEAQLQEALKENKEIMDMVQVRRGDLTRNSYTSLGSSLSTMSLVNLQYKYEELLANHRGLLKMLEFRTDEVKKHLAANNTLQEKVEKLMFDLGTAQDKITFLHRKIADVKRRKHEKISRLKAEGRTLSLVHRRLVAILHKQCMERNDFVQSLLRTTSRSEKGLLLEEIRKNNILNYENFQLQQEVDYLRTTLCEAARCRSRETIKSAKSMSEV